MKKSVLSTAIAGTMLAVSSVAIGQTILPSPDLILPEKGAFTCIEQSLSLVAALSEKQGCDDSVDYTLDGDIEFNGFGSCTIDDATVAVATVADNELRGTHQQTSIPVAGEIGDVDFLNLDGNFWYSGKGEIMYADAHFQLCVLNCGSGFPGAEDYDEHVIKDFFAEPMFLPDRLVIDQGLEVITKENYPRMKFRQSSTYVPPNGGLGEILIDKISVAPSNAPECMIKLDLVVDDFGGGIQFTGNVMVVPM